jgi:hypothetical protein
MMSEAFALPWSEGELRQAAPGTEVDLPVFDSSHDVIVDNAGGGSLCFPTKVRCLRLFIHCYRKTWRL